MFFICFIIFGANEEQDNQITKTFNFDKFKYPNFVILFES